MVWRGEKPSLREASCCSVEVVKGAAGLRRCDLLSMFETTKRPPSSAALSRSAVAASAMSNLSSFLPSAENSLAWKVSFLPVASSAMIVQYSCGLNCSISSSRSQTSLSATDWTRPAERAPGSFRQHRGKGEADEIIERSAGEIGVDQRPVD